MSVSATTSTTTSTALPTSTLDQIDIIKYIHKYSAYDAEKLEDLGTLLQRK